MEMKVEEYRLLSGKILDASIEVHRHVGPGLLESVYEVCLAKELGWRGIAFQQQAVLPCRLQRRCFRQRVSDGFLS